MTSNNPQGSYTTGIWIDRYRTWMKPYLQPFTTNPIVTTLSGKPPSVIQDSDFTKYPLTKIVYHLDSPNIIETIKSHITHFPNAELYGFGHSSKTGKPYTLKTKEIKDVIESMQPELEIETNQYVTPSGVSLRDYQNQMVDFALTKKRSGLFVDMGLGKTLATLEVINQLHVTDKLDISKPILVVAPKIVALDTWSRESVKWGYDWDILVNIGLSKAKREQLLERALPGNLTKPTLLTTNPDQLKQIITFFNQRRIYRPFQMIVIDELSMFKTATTQRFDYMQSLARNAEYFIGLTGTPAPNNLLDIWSQVMLINKAFGDSLGTNFFSYRGRFFEPDMVDRRKGIVYSWKIRHGAEKFIYSKLKTSVISMKTDGKIKLPDITYVNEYVKLKPKVMKTYEKWDKEIRKQLQQYDQAEIDVDGSDLLIQNTATLKSKLLQLAGGAVYEDMFNVDNTMKQYTVFHDAKFERLKEIAEVATSPILVFYQFKSDLERAREFVEFTELNPNSNDIQQVIKDWNNGSIPVLFAHPASAGHGLNLQDGGHTIIWLSPTWSNEQYRQANKRLHRSGQQNPVQVIHIIAEGTADEEVIARLDEKEDGQRRLIDALEQTNNI